MERTRGKLRLCIVFLLLNIVFIWGNSLLPGSVSGALSDWVRQLLARIFAIDSVGSDSAHGLLRKLAHFTEFGCLGGLLTWLLSMLRKPAWQAFFCGFFVAGVDETIQRFVPDRGPSFVDVLIDSGGVLLGIILLRVGYTIVAKRAKKALEDTK